MLIAVSIGRWSELSAFSVSQWVRLYRFEVMDVMSGDVGCWFAAKGKRVCVLVFSVIWLEFPRRSAMRSPLWSVVCESQMGEWAFMSPEVIELGRLVMYWMKDVISASQVAWSGLVVFLGGCIYLRWCKFCCWLCVIEWFVVLCWLDWWS